MTVTELLQKLHRDHTICVRLYAPAVGYENRFYKLGYSEFDFSNEEVLGYEFIEGIDIDDANIIINKPVDFTKVSTTIHFIDGQVYEMSSTFELQLALEELYEYWPVHIDYRTGEEWHEDEQMTICESNNDPVD